MRSRLGILRQALLFVLAVVAGGLLGGILTAAWNSILSAWYSTFEPRTLTPFIVVGFAMTFAAFGLVPALFFGLPAVCFLKLIEYSRLRATAVLTVGGGLIGAGLMSVTFTGFEMTGAIAGSSIGFMLGMLLFNRRAASVGP